MRDADIKDFSAFLEEFQDETDRGAALVGAALLDLRLADTLRAFMVAGPVADKLLDGGTAPLGTLSARIKTCFALGLIDKHEHDECDLVRKIRNEFAHRAHGFSFVDAKVSALCDRLQADLPGGRAAFVGKPRLIFINAVVFMALALTYRAEYVERERRETKSWPR